MSVLSRMWTVAPRLLFGIACIPLLTPTVGVAQSSGAAAQQLELALQRPVTLAWQGQSLAAALERLRQSAGAAIWLDRRVDPRTPVNLNAADRPVIAILSQLAEARDCGISEYYGVAYFGPRRSAAELLTLSVKARDSLAKAPAHVRRRWLTPEPWSINRLSEPRGLLRELAKSANATLQGAELVPHDLWPARTLPSMTPLDRVVLMLVGFDLTCELSPDGRQVHILPIKRPVQVTRSYAISRQRQPAIDELLAALPEATVKHDGGRATVGATVEDHERIAATVRGNASGPSASSHRRSPPSKSPAASAQRFTLKIQNQPVGRVLDQLSTQLQLAIEWDAAIEDGPGQGRGALVSCEVTQVDLDGLLEALLSPAGLQAERAGQQVTVRPAP